MAQKIQIRHDTAANWTSVNPVLMVGEQGYETDTGKSKIGDGGTSWTALSYVSVPSFTGPLVGDVTGTQGATVVSTVGGSTAANVHTAEVAANAATNAATASTIMKRDANSNAAINNINEAFVTTATAAGTTTLTVASAPLQQFTGTTTQAVNLPDATTLPVGCQYYVFNRSTGIVTVKDGSVSHATVQAISGGGQCCFTLAANGTAAGTWDTTYTYTGTLPIALGGTGQTTANAALNALLPSQTGSATKFLKTDGTNTSWAPSAGPTAPTTQKFTSGSGTYTTPAGVLYIRVRMVGGGGGGGGSGTATQGAGGAGGSTTFGTAYLTAGGGSGGGQGGAAVGGAGGAATGIASGIAIAGAAGSSASGTNTSLTDGGAGGNSAFGGGGAGTNNGASSAGVTNSGGGGSGGGTGSTATQIAAGGGAGAYVEAIITSPSATYAYGVGAGGSAGTAGTNGNAGGVGGSGILFVEEFYQ